MLENKKIIVNEFKDVLKFVEKNFREVLVLLNKYGVVTSERVKRSFSDEKEVDKFLEKLVIDYLNEKYNNLHERISELRKKGFDLTEVGLKLSSFKLKLKMFAANKDKHSFNQVILILDNVEKELGEINFEEKKDGSKLLQQSF